MRHSLTFNGTKAVLNGTNSLNTFVTTNGFALKLIGLNFTNWNVVVKSSNSGNIHHHTILYAIHLYSGLNF